MNRLKRWAVLLMILALFSLSGCSQLGVYLSPPATPSPTPVLNTPSPMPEIQAEPAKLIQGVETDKKVVSIIFEGYSDEATMEAIAAILAERHIPTTFFVSGVTADEHREMLSRIAGMGFGIGNYGMSGSKKLERNPPYLNAEWFSRTQELITDACHVKPKYVRCNGTVYTDLVLRAITAAGLDAGVEPSSYLNHRSFKVQSDAELFALSLVRGSILSVKLGQELDENEFGDSGGKLDERPAIDPSPGIRRNWEATEERFEGLPDLVQWLVDAILANGYEIVELEDLEAAAVTLLPKVRELEHDELYLMAEPVETVPVSAEPLTAGNTKTVQMEELSGSVFLGDSVMTGFEDYVLWQRTTDPAYLQDVSFITDKNASVESFINNAEALSLQIQELNVKRVFLCLGFTSADGYKRASYLANYRLLLYWIRENNPDVTFIIMGVPPKMEGYPGTGNAQRFRLNRMLCGMCRMYGLGFIDTAFPLRDETGALREDYCLDKVSYGRSLNDRGCEVLLDFILEHFPTDDDEVDEAAPETGDAVTENQMDGKPGISTGQSTGL